MTVEAAAAVLERGSGDPATRAALELTAPVAGVVLRRHFESARPVQAGEPLIEIGDPAGIEVEVDVLSADAVRLREGMRVELLRWGETRPLAGRVRRVEPGGFTKFSALGVEEQRVWVMVEITSPRDGVASARRGLPRQCALRAAREGDDAARADQRDFPAATAALRCSGSRAGARSARRCAPDCRAAAGSRSRTACEEGDRLIVHPDRELEDGQLVQVRATSEP